MGRRDLKDREEISGRVLVSSHWDAERVVWLSFFLFPVLSTADGISASAVFQFDRQRQVPRLCATDLTGSLPVVLVDRSLFSHSV